MTPAVPENASPGAASPRAPAPGTSAPAVPASGAALPDALREEMLDLRERLREAEETIEAIRQGDVDAVVVGGDLARVYDIFVAGLRESLYAQASALATRELVIAPVTHGEQSGIVGCAAMAIREILDSAAVDRALAAASS